MTHKLFTTSSAPTLLWRMGQLERALQFLMAHQLSRAAEMLPASGAEKKRGVGDGAWGGCTAPLGFAALACRVVQEQGHQRDLLKIFKTVGQA